MHTPIRRSFLARWGLLGACPNTMVDLPQVMNIGEDRRGVDSNDPETSPGGDVSNTDDREVGGGHDGRRRMGRPTATNGDDGKEAFAGLGLGQICSAWPRCRSCMCGSARCRPTQRPTGT